MTSSLNDSFNGKPVFVTGHTGFKGSWLALWLARLGANVTGYSLAPPTDPSNFAASNVADVLHGHYEADVRDASRLHEALQAGGPEVVFHLAAQPLVRESYLAPRETFEVNVIGTASLLDGIRALGRPCVVIVVTSDKCYENRERVWGYREIDAMGGHDPYSASKGASEILAASYRRSFFPPESISEHGVKLATVRAGNVIGGGDWAEDRIVADMVKALSLGREVPVRSPDSIRPWQHVLDPLGGYLSLAARMLESDAPGWCSAWNFGPAGHDTLSVGELVERFCEAWGGGSWRDCSSSAAVHEANVLRLNTDKATWELGWRPRWRLAEAITRAALWYRRFYEGSGDMRRACTEDIMAYEEASPAGTECSVPGEAAREKK